MESKFDFSCLIWICNQGPAFAIIGAWLMYQIQNRDVIANDDSEDLFKKAIIITALGFILCNLGPIDEWYTWLTLFTESILIDITQKIWIFIRWWWFICRSHSGAAFTGMAYGFLTSPALQLDETSPGTDGEGLKLVTKYGASCKSLVIFAIFVVVLSSLILFMDPPLDALASVVALEYMSIFGWTAWELYM